MFKLIKNAIVYAPEYLGKKDLLLCGEKIVKIADAIEFPDAEVIDKTGFTLMPGIIDVHVHVTGGGGEGGFNTRTPEVQLSALIKGGVTTVIGLLGTDSYTRSVENLVAKTKALKKEGISAYCLTGAYRYPSPTLTGEVGKDIAFIDEVIGVKLALSDHRESAITKTELVKLAFEVRVASLIGDKAGIVTLHMGDGDKTLDDVFAILAKTPLPAFHLRPTHVNRNEKLFLSALKFMEKGGYIDITCSDRFDRLKTSLNSIKERKLPLSLVTLSSDGNGSYSKYDQNGKLTEIGVAGCDAIAKNLKYLLESGFKPEEVIPLCTSNAAISLKLETRKGFIKPGYDADLVILDSGFDIDTVIAKGRIMMKEHEILVKGTFE